MTHRFTPEEIEGFLTFLLEGGADKRYSDVYLIITQLREDLAECRQNKVSILEREVENTANEIDQMFRQQHSMKDLEHALMRLINRLRTTEPQTPEPEFEAFWVSEKHRPPYTNPKAIAKSAWDAVCTHFKEK